LNTVGINVIKIAQVALAEGVFKGHRSETAIAKVVDEGLTQGSPLELCNAEIILRALHEQGFDSKDFQDRLTKHFLKKLSAVRLHIWTSPTYLAALQNLNDLIRCQNTCHIPTITEEDGVLDWNTFFTTPLTALHRNHISYVMKTIFNLFPLESEGLTPPPAPFETLLWNEKTSLRNAIGDDVFLRLPLPFTLRKNDVLKENPFSNPVEHKRLTRLKPHLYPTSLNPGLNRTYTNNTLDQIAIAYKNHQPTHLKNIATNLAFSEATLKRKLAVEKNGFLEIKTFFKMNQSLILLLRRLDISEICDRLDYASGSSFSRKFKNWYRISPSQFLKRYDAD
jgi:AraC-like DNA-binding protein